jgi:hypothetical protein
MGILQVSTNGFLGRDMVNVSLGNSEAALFLGAAAGTTTTVLNRAEVVCKFPVAEFQGAGRDNRIAETLISH